MTKPSLQEINIGAIVDNCNGSVKSNVDVETVTFPKKITETIHTSTIVVSTENVITEIPGKKTKVEDDAWKITPIKDSSKLINQYLMLSKSRLTCMS